MRISRVESKCPPEGSGPGEGRERLMMRRRGGGAGRWVRLGRGASGPCSLGLQCMLSQWSLGVSSRPAGREGLSVMIGLRCEGREVSSTKQISPS
jgi:hypothetical protein